MKQVAGLAKLAGTWTTSSALSRVQSPKSEAVASEQTRIKAVSIKNGSHHGLMGASSVSPGLRLEQAGAAFQARTGPIRALADARAPLRVRGSDLGTWTTSSALSRVQSPKSEAVASEQTRIKAVSIKNGSHHGLMGASSVSPGLRLEQAGAAFQARTGPIRALADARAPLRVRG